MIPTKIHIYLLIWLAADRIVASSAELGKIIHFQETQTSPGEGVQVEQPPVTDQFAHTDGSHRPRSPLMQLRKLSPTSNNITCNDGSPVGYYERLNSHSKSWIIYLQGGGFCGGHESCQQRWARSAHLMSSKYWPKTRTVDGILSDEPKDNPYLWNANHIYVPYCSSDSWSGLAPAKAVAGARQKSPYAFMGSMIIERVLDSLYDDRPRNSSLHEAKFILLAGDSAGATGVILNLDKVNSFIEKRAAAAQAHCIKSGSLQEAGCEQKQAPMLRGLADSGWFLDNEPYDHSRQETGSFAGFGELDHEQVAPIDCDRARCTPSQSIRQAMRLWNGQVPETCANKHQLEPWRCYFGYRAYQTLKTPLFVVQWLYDEVQLMVDNIARPDTSGQWNYVNKLVNEMRASLENVTALFAPSCFSHSLITRRSWNEININGFKLPHVLNSWEEQSLLDTGASAIIANQINKLDEVQRAASEPFALEQVSAEERRQLNAGSGAPTRITVSPPGSGGSQPSFESLLAEASANRALAGVATPDNAFAQRDTFTKPSGPNVQELQRQPSHKTQNGNTNRPRNRKRRRNNQQQKNKQMRPKPHQVVETGALPVVEPVQISTTRDPMNNDLSQAQNSMQELLPLTDTRTLASSPLLNRLNRETRSSSGFANGRLGRSTLVDDATLMLSNNMPDDNLAAAHNPPLLTSPENRLPSWPSDSQIVRVATFDSANSVGAVQARFRLIDSCGWPQCNRDCPVMDSDFNSAAFL